MSALRCTPLDHIHLTHADECVAIYIKRDDLYLVTGGGNKGRKMAHFLPAILRGNHDALVSCGGIQSNHARVVALTAASHGWRCRLVLHGDAAALRQPIGNLLLMQLTGAEIIVTTPDHMAEELERAASRFRKEGYNPYSIPGGGHALEGALAYADAVDELAEQMNDRPPDVIILASGTGTTQAGILAGVERRGWSTRVVGISIARKSHRGTAVVRAAYDEVRQHLRLNGSPLSLEFHDAYIGEGYEQASPAIWHTIRQVASEAGIVLDPTYTGKAFHGMQELIRSGLIPTTARIVFWHTGGLLNLFAADKSTITRET